MKPISILVLSGQPEAEVNIGILMSTRRRCQYWYFQVDMKPRSILEILMSTRSRCQYWYSQVDMKPRSTFGILRAT